MVAPAGGARRPANGDYLSDEQFGGNPPKPPLPLLALKRSLT
jgi:hypothetical protein